MRLIIHRGTKEIGGSCVELQSQDRSLLLDLGLPLSNPDGSEFDVGRIRNRSVQDMIADQTLPDVPGLYGTGACNVEAILLTHAHLDHYGLGHFVRTDVPVFATQGTALLLSFSKAFFKSIPAIQNLKLLENRWKPTRMGPFTVRAHPVDHSAPDAIALEIEADGKKVFYTGDLRGHGRTRKRFDHLLARPPKNVDVLLMEGSSLGREAGEYSDTDEKSVEDQLARLMKNSNNPVLLFCSSQNLDRIVSAFRAAKRSGRLFVIDLYIAYFLHLLRPLSRSLPQYDWPEVRVKFWPHHMKALRKADPAFYNDVVFSGNGAKNTVVIRDRSRILMVARMNKYDSPLIEQLAALGPLDMVWSMWSGYLKRDGTVLEFCKAHSLDLHRIHASGHATVKDLGRLARAVGPKCVVPIHTFHGDAYEQFGVRVNRLRDGQVLAL